MILHICLGTKQYHTMRRAQKWQTIGVERVRHRLTIPCKRQLVIESGVASLTNASTACQLSQHLLSQLQHLVALVLFQELFQSLLKGDFLSLQYVREGFEEVHLRHQRRERILRMKLCCQSSHRHRITTQIGSKGLVVEPLLLLLSRAELLKIVRRSHRLSQGLFGKLCQYFSSPSLSFTCQAAPLHQHI